MEDMGKWPLGQVCRGGRLKKEHETGQKCVQIKGNKPMMTADIEKLKAKKSPKAPRRMKRKGEAGVNGDSNSGMGHTEKKKRIGGEEHKGERGAVKERTGGATPGKKC